MKLKGPTCQRMGIVLQRPCSLSACRYHVAYESSFNCAVVHLKGRSDEQIGVHELAALERRPVENIERILATAQNIVTVWTLREEVPPQFSRVPGRCVSCGEEAEPKSLYCEDADCRETMPEWRAIIEERFGVNAEMAIGEVVARAGRERAIELLSLDPAKLRELCPEKARRPREAAIEEPVAVRGLTSALFDRYRAKVFARWGTSKLTFAALLPAL